MGMPMSPAEPPLPAPASPPVVLPVLITIPVLVVGLPPLLAVTEFEFEFEFELEFELELEFEASDPVFVAVLSPESSKLDSPESQANNAAGAATIAARTA